MSSKNHTEAKFLERYLNGDVLAGDIDDYVDLWHERCDDQQIYEFLGLTRDEYALWLRDPDVLPHIARARRENQPLAKVIASSMKEMPMAARSSDVVKIQRLKRWLAQRQKSN